MARRGEKLYAVVLGPKDRTTSRVSGIAEEQGS